MLLAVASSLTVLTLAACCAHRLWFGARLWQALVFLPPMVGAWAASLVVRTPTEMGALVTFLTGDLALYGLAILGVMRMLGGLPVGPDDGGSDEDGGGGDDAPAPFEPSPSGGSTRRERVPRRWDRGSQARRPRPPRRATRRSRPAPGVPRGSRARAKWWSARSD